MKGKSSSRITILIVLIALIVVSFVIHYSVSGDFLETNAVLAYLVGTFAPQVGNSLIVFTLLWWFGWPMVEKKVAERKATIEHDMDESRELKDAAVKAASEASEKMAALDDEKKQMEKSYNAALKAECAQIREDAERESERLLADSEISFELQSASARKAFEREVMTKSIDRAREDIERRLARDASLRDRLIDQSIASFEL